MTDYCGERTTDGPRCRERVPCPIHEQREEPVTDKDRQREALAACRKTLEESRKGARK